MALLEVRGLVKRFLGVTAVDRVDLTVERGELVSLIGRIASPAWAWGVPSSR